MSSREEDGDVRHPCSAATATAAAARSTNSSSGSSGTGSHDRSRRSATAFKSASAGTASSHTAQQRNNPSMTATGGGSFQTGASAPGNEAYTSVHPAPAMTAERSRKGRGTPSAPLHQSFEKASMSPLDAAASAAAASPDVRDTVEYRAAWDLELWKAVQVDRFRKQLERQKNAALVRLESAIRQREKAAKVELARRAQTVTAREAAVEAAEAHLAAQQSRLAEMEKDLRRTRQQLMDAQQRVEDEVRAQVRLANDTIAHRARLLEERVNAAESQAKRAEERQRRAQQDYLTLYEAFSRARSQQLTSATTNANDLLGVSPCTGAGASTAMQLGQLRAHWDAEHQRQLDREEQRHTAEVAAMKGCCRELAEQNHRLTAALARRREQLRRVQSTACAAASAAAAATKPSASLAPAMHTTTGETPEPITRELHRLAMERISLVDGSSGAVRETDAVIVRMDSRMRDLRQQLVAAGSDNTRGDGTE